MPDTRLVSVLIGRIYDCALDTGLWPGALREITDAVGGSRGDLFVSDPINKMQRVAIHYNWPDEAIVAAQANALINPGLPYSMTTPLCEVVCSSRDWDIEAFHRSLYWQRCYANQGLYDYIASPVTRTVSSVSSWGIIGSVTKGAYTDEDIELARLLSPHIKRSIEISGVLTRSTAETTTLRAALDALATPALVVDPDGAILFLNKAADTELAGGQLLGRIANRLVGVTSEARRLLATMSMPSLSKRPAADAFLTDATGRTLHATWAEIEQVGSEMGSTALLLLREPEAAFTTPLASAAALYSLTRAEIQVLGQVLQGRVLADIAEIMGLGRSTVKTHLESLFRKTQSSRQTELVARIMSLASPLRG